MKNYKFTTSAHDIKGFFGVDYRGLTENEIALTEIGWNGWTSEELQTIINESKSLGDNQEFDYEVEGSDFYILVKKSQVLMWARNSEVPDITWSFDKFISFMEDFKKFVKRKQLILVKAVHNCEKPQQSMLNLIQYVAGVLYFTNKRINVYTYFKHPYNPQ